MFLLDISDDVADAINEKNTTFVRNFTEIEPQRNGNATGVMDMENTTWVKNFTDVEPETKGNATNAIEMENSTLLGNLTMPENPNTKGILFAFFFYL